MSNYSQLSPCKSICVFAHSHNTHQPNIFDTAKVVVHGPQHKGELRTAGLKCTKLCSLTMAL